MLPNISAIPISTKLVVKDTTNECRICLENNGKELIYPCKCKFPVHRECLIKWLNSDANTIPNRCEICRTNYNSDFVIIINRNIDRNVDRNLQNNRSRNIMNYQRRQRIVRRKQCIGLSIIALLSSDALLSYYFYCFNDDTLNIYVLIFVNFIIICIFGSVNTFINNSQYMYID